MNKSIELDKYGNSTARNDARTKKKYMEVHITIELLMHEICENTCLDLRLYSSMVIWIHTIYIKLKMFEGYKTL